MTSERLPSWRAGGAREKVLDFLDTVDDVPVADRVAYVDNDGTMWCERPRYVQLDFFVDALQRMAGDDPSLAERPELDAVLSNDPAKIGEIGLARIAVALAGLFDDRSPRDFAVAVDEFVGRYRHPTLGVSVAGLVYQPMLELLGELRAHEFTVGIVTGGGTEFVRRVSTSLYGVPPELVVGTMIGYELDRDASGRPSLKRTSSLIGTANEGAAKVEHIQSHIGRPPIFCAGNSGGDREMLEWACAAPGGGLAILVNHDDDDREFAYEGKGATTNDTEPITDVADRLGWTTVSMKNDWSTVFAS